MSAHAHLPSATNTMASACVVSTGAVQPSTSPGDKGLQPGIDREGKEGDSATRAAWMAEENWMVPASTCARARVCVCTNVCVYVSVFEPRFHVFY